MLQAATFACETHQSPQIPVPDRETIFTLKISENLTCDLNTFRLSVLISFNIELFLSSFSSSRTPFAESLNE